MSAPRSELADRIVRAKDDATAAEGDLDRAIRAIVEQPRHEKVAVGKLVEAALARVRVVRAELALLEQLAARDDD